MENNAPDDQDLKKKIARLVEERGWNQEDFAREAKLNRETARDILGSGKRKLRNTTVSACARSLGLTISELRDVPLTALVQRIRPLGTTAGDGLASRRRFEEAMQPELRAWLDRNSERASSLTDDDIDELLSLQGTGGPLTALGVEHFIALIERRKRLIDKVHVVAGTHYLSQA